MITMKDIAARLNISHTTVSRALSNSPLVNETTKNKILALAKELNYVPNLSARSLVQVRSYHVGIFFSSLTKATSPDFVFSIIETVYRFLPPCYHVVIHAINQLGDHFHISRSNYDGILLISQLQSDDDFIKKILSTNVPIVVINRNTHPIPVSNIYCDEKFGINCLIKSLSKNGHRHICYVHGNRESSSNLRRFHAFQQAMHQYQQTIFPEYLFYGDFSVESGYRQTAKLLTLTTKPRPTAIIYASDSMAFGGLKLLHERNILVPDDISVAGIDGSLLAQYSIPRLVSINRPIKKMAELGIQKLFGLINGEKINPTPIKLVGLLENGGSIKNLSIK